MTEEQKKEREEKADEAFKRIAAESKEVSVGEKLEQLEKELRRTLSVKEADHERCLQVLQEISALNLTPTVLMKNKTIIPTMKKVKAYKANHSVSEKASQLYYHYKSLFAIGGTGVAGAKFFTPPVKSTSNQQSTEQIKTQVQINISISNGEKIEEVPVTITHPS